MKALILANLLVVLAGCATPYGKYGIAGGYRDARIDDNTFSISVDANGFTSQQTASMHGLYRAAELTVQNGFDYFVIVSGADNSRSMVMAMPGASTTNTTVNVYGPTAYARSTTTTSPTTFVPVVFPNSTLILKVFKGAKPEGVSGAYDARSVMNPPWPADWRWNT